MADNEQPAITPNNASRTEVPPETHVDRHGHAGTSFTAGEETDRDEYVLNLEEEIMALRMYKQNKESESSHPVFGNVPPPQHKVCSFKTFMSSNPSVYSGSTNPSVTMDWLRDMERKFEVCRCEDEVKVPYAAQLLKGPAMTWWDSITSVLTPFQKASIRWSDFYNEVCKQYCSDFDISRIRKEFMELHLTDRMSIDDLINQFSEKLRFVQQWVPDERTRVEQFVGTLPSNYRTTVRLAGSLSQAFMLARSVDSDLRIQDEPSKDRSSQKFRSESSGKGKQRWQGNQQGKKEENRSGTSDRAN